MIDVSRNTMEVTRGRIHLLRQISTAVWAFLIALKASSFCAGVMCATSLGERSPWRARQLWKHWL